MHDVHRHRMLKLVAPSVPDRSAKVIALRSRREARLEDRIPRRDPERSPPRPAA